MRAVFFILAALSSSALALESDRQLPIEVLQADSSVLDNQANEMRFVGNVIVVQGNLRIESDNLVVKYIERDGTQEVDQITAVGQPAYFRDLINEGEAPIELWGETLDYLVSPERITATGNARMEKGCNRQESPRISYEGETKRIVTERVSGSVLPGLADGTDCE